MSTLFSRAFVWGDVDPHVLLAGRLCEAMSIVIVGEIAYAPLLFCQQDRQLHEAHVLDAPLAGMDGPYG
jgi:hypothetical protein